MLESYNTIDSTVVYNFLGRVPDFEKGSVIIIDTDTMGYLRKVTDVSIDGHTATMKTKPADMTDIFMDINFNLTTSMIEPVNHISKTSSGIEISEALTDENGYIHPIEIIYNTHDGKRLHENIFKVNSSEEDTSFALIYKDFSNTILHGNRGEDIYLYISTGYYHFQPDVVFEFSIGNKEKYDEFDKDKKIKKGDLNYFKYYLDGEAEFNTMFNLELQTKYDNHIDYSKHIKSFAFKFIVAGVPVWITIDSYLNTEFDINSNNRVNASWGFKATSNVKFGVQYDKQNKFSLIKTANFKKEIYPLTIKGDLHAFAKLKLFPEIDILFYNTFGPSIEIVPYVVGEYDAKSINNNNSSFLAWNSSINFGLDLLVAGKVKFLWDLVWETKDLSYDIVPQTKLWYSPKRIDFITKPFEKPIGSKTQIDVKVYDSRDEPVISCPVYFHGTGSLSKQVDWTGLDGKAKVDWTLSNNAGINNINAKIYGSNGYPIHSVGIQATGYNPNTLTISPTSKTVDSSSGNINFSVNSNVTWSVSDNASWLSATKANNSTVSVSYNSNGSTSSRTATITVSGGGLTRTATVTQNSAPPTQSKLKVTFLRIEVIKDGDIAGAGEFYWEFYLTSAGYIALWEISSVSREDAVSASDPISIYINKSAEFYEDNTDGSLFNIFYEVREADVGGDTVVGKDDFRYVYDTVHGWPTGVEEVYYSNGGAEIKVVWMVEVL